MISLFKQNKFINIRGSFNYYVGTKEGRGGGGQGGSRKKSTKANKGRKAVVGSERSHFKRF